MQTVIKPHPHLHHHTENASSRQRQSPKECLHSSSSIQLIRDFILEENAQHRIVVWSVSNSPYCAATKKMLEPFGAVVHDLDQLGDQGALVQRELKRLSAQSTLPNVFYDNSHLGGYDNVRQAFLSGALHQVFAATTAEHEHQPPQQDDSSSSSLDEFARKSSSAASFMEDYFVFPSHNSSGRRRASRRQSLSVIQESSMLPSSSPSSRRRLKTLSCNALSSSS